MSDPRAESAYRAAYELALTRPGEEGDPIHEYGRWLLRHGRPQEALALIPAETYADYTLDLLHGVVLEKLGRLQEADDYYALYRKKSGDGALPLDRFYASHQELRIPGSELQRKYHLQFEGFEDGGEGNKLAEDLNTINGLSFMLFGEANLENVGGQRAVAWAAKGRALRGRATKRNDGTFCPAVPAPVDRPNESLLVKYQQVLCQRSGKNNWEFDGMRDRCPKWCTNTKYTSCQKSDENYRVAYTVFSGMAPDPVSQRCANGAVLETPDCAGRVACETQADGSPGAYFLDGPHSFNSDGSKQCGTNRGKVCANGRTDHTFFTNPVWPSKQSGWPTENLYSGMIPEESDLVSLPVQADGKAYFSVSRKMRMRAHLEHSDIGTDGVDLVLEAAPTPDGPWDFAPVLIFSDGAYGDIIFDSLSTSATKPQYFRWDVIGPEGMKFKLYLSYTLF
ncbi:MAG TPA: hypothetical protein VEW48_21890 [Thermoanaerobaculia bacterium]|nr:hypothetical protein [Thermoanaerobaculia bacterium]